MASLLRSAVATAVKRPPSVDEVMGMAPPDAALPLAHYQKFWSWLSSQSPDAMDRARTEQIFFSAELASRSMSMAMSKAPSGSSHSI